MKIQLRSIYSLLFFIPWFLVSCHTKEKLVYFQENEGDSAKVSSKNNYTPTLKIDDYLEIIITSDQVELSAPFNKPPTGQIANGGYIAGNPVNSGYLINEKGFVELPILGQIKVAGLSRIEAVNLIKEKLKDYLTNPNVQIQIQNYKITVLGDVNSPGTYRIPNERITILEALGLAGDLKITGVRKNVLIIREVDNEKQEYRIDLTKKDFLNSPVYYLQQNDVVYVEPNMTARSNSTMWRATGGIIISLTSLVISTIVLIAR